MSDLKIYCDKTYKRLIGLKSGLYDVMIKAETMQDVVHSEAISQLKGLLVGIEAGVNELKSQCPADWSPEKKKIRQQNRGIENYFK